MVDANSISDRTTVGVFLRQAHRLTDRPILHRWVDGRWEPTTWDRFRDLVLRTAGRLIELGIEPGDRVILMSPNRIEWNWSDLGIQAAGAVTVPIYPSTPAEQARQIAANCQAVVAIVDTEDTASRLELGGDLRCVVRMDRELVEWADGAFPEGKLDDLDRRLPAIGPEDVATIIYTSGTTGEPKGVVLLHRNLVDMARSSLQAFSIGEGDVGLSFLPLAHVLERESSAFVGMTAGIEGYLSRGIDQLVDDLRDVRPTIMVSVPRVYEKMFDRVHDQVRAASPVRRALFKWAIATGRRRAEGRAAPGYALADRVVLSRLRELLTGGRLRFFVSGGAPLAKDVEEFFWAIGVKILQGWGMTETTSGATSNTETEHRYRTVGRALPGVELKIAEDGEILVRGPGIMREYYRNPEATAQVLEPDGWLHTGDVGELDGDGFLTITDRKKDLIKTAGGKYVAPQPLEARLQQDPGIERVVVIGDDRPYCVALVVPNWEHLAPALQLSGSHEEMAGDERVRDYIQKRVDAVNSGLGSWETIKYFRVLADDFTEDSGELTPTLKVKRKVVGERHAQEIEELYSSNRRSEKAQPSAH